MKMFVWSQKPAFLAVAQSDSIENARTLMLSEIGASGDGSCPERDKARLYVRTNNPAIWIGHVAEFELTDSAQLAEVDDECEKKRKRIIELEDRIRELEAMLREMLSGIDCQPGYLSTLGIARAKFVLEGTS